MKYKLTICYKNKINIGTQMTRIKPIKTDFFCEPNFLNLFNPCHLCAINELLIRLSDRHITYLNALNP